MPSYINKPCYCKQSLHEVDVQLTICRCSGIALDVSTQELYAAVDVFGYDTVSTIQAVDSSVAWIEELFTKSKVIPSADNQHPSAVEASIQPMCKEDRKHHRRRSSFKPSEEFTESFLSELNVSNVMDESMSVGTLSGADDVSVSSSTYVSGVSSSTHSSNGSIMLEECVDGSVSSSHPSLGSWVVDKTCLSTDDELESQEDEDDDYLCSFAFDYGGWDNNKKQPI